MHEAKPKTDAGPTAETLARGYEIGDVSMTTAIVFTVSLAVFLAVSFLAMFVLWHLLTNTQPGADGARSIVTDTAVDMTSAPIQPTQAHNRKPAEDLYVMKRNEAAVFKKMGWMDDTTNSVRVPDDLVTAVAKKQSAARTAGGSVDAPVAPKTPVITPVPGSDEGMAK